MKNLALVLIFAAALHAQEHRITERLDASGPALQPALNHSSANTGKFVNAKDYGAKCDGAADDTAAFQAAILAVRPGGVLLGDTGEVCRVTGIFLKSAMTVRNLRLKAIGHNQNLSVITIDGTMLPKRHIAIRNVVVDGSRRDMSDFSTSNGSKQCFALLGSVSDVVLENINGSFCGTDGLQLFSYKRPATDADRDLRLRRIRIQGGVFKYNRRQGMSADSLYGVDISGVVAEYNGLDMSEIQTIYAASPAEKDLADWQPGDYTAVATCDLARADDAASRADCGSRLASGKKYASGIDIEGYGVGSGINHLSIEHCSAIHNARGGLLILDATDPASPGYVTRSHIHIVNNTMDRGLYYWLGPSQWALYITGDGAAAPIGLGYRDVHIQGNSIAGVLALFGMSKVFVEGNRIRSDVDYAIYTGSVDALSMRNNDLDGKPLRYFDTFGTSKNPGFEQIAFSLKRPFLDFWRVARRRMRGDS